MDPTTRQRLRNVQELVSQAQKAVYDNAGQIPQDAQGLQARVWQTLDDLWEEIGFALDEDELCPRCGDPLEEGAYCPTCAAA